jgi:hypothetical protein
MVSSMMSHREPRRGPHPIEEWRSNRSLGLFRADVTRTAVADESECCPPALHATRNKTWRCHSSGEDRHSRLGRSPYLHIVWRPAATVKVIASVCTALLRIEYSLCDGANHRNTLLKRDNLRGEHREFGGKKKQIPPNAFSLIEKSHMLLRDSTS